MFRQMRRNMQSLSKAECETILMQGTSGVLAVLGDDGYPYAVPLSYYYCDSILYFHCAKIGHKLEAIKHYDKASFCIIGLDNPVPEEFTTYFKSVIAFGRVSVITDSDELYYAITHIAQKYSENMSAGAIEHEIAKNYKNLCILKLNIEHLSGKICRELINKLQ